jgi:hypothetical protein
LSLTWVGYRDFGARRPYVRSRHATGTVYALTDPSDGAIRYVGQTVQELAGRLHGHSGGGGGTMPYVTAWIEVLAAVGLRPGILALRENVPSADLDTAESEAVLERIIAGDDLLNRDLPEKAIRIVRERRRIAPEYMRQVEFAGGTRRRLAWRRE